MDTLTGFAKTVLFQ